MEPHFRALTNVATTMSGSPTPPTNNNAPELFAPPPPPEDSSRRTLIGLVCGILGIVIALVVIFSHGGRNSSPSQNPNEPTPLALYAANLPLTNTHMSTATVPAGGKLYYIEGEVQNTGKQTITGATVELLFKDSLGKIAQRETEPLRVVIATEPALDTTDLAHAPLAPGQSRQFRITIEHVSNDWNGEYPELRIIRTSSK